MKKQSQPKDFSTSTHDYIPSDTYCEFIPKSNKIDQIFIYLCGYQQTYKQILKNHDFQLAFPENTKAIIHTPPVIFSRYSNKPSLQWFNVTKKAPFVVDILDEFEWSEMLTELYKIKDWVNEAVQVVGDSKKVVIGGFSQGGIMCSIFPTFYDKPLGGVVINCHMFPKSFRPNEMHDRTPFFWSHGKKDPIIKMTNVIPNHSVSLFNGKRYVKFVLEEEGGHQLYDSQVAGLKEFLIEAKTKDLRKRTIPKPKL